MADRTNFKFPTAAHLFKNLFTIKCERGEFERICCMGQYVVQLWENASEILKFIRNPHKWIRSWGTVYRFSILLVENTMLLFKFSPWRACNCFRTYFNMFFILLSCSLNTSLSMSDQPALNTIVFIVCQNDSIFGKFYNYHHCYS